MLSCSQFLIGDLGLYGDESLGLDRLNDASIRNCYNEQGRKTVMPSVTRRTPFRRHKRTLKQRYHILKWKLKYSRPLHSQREKLAVRWYPDVDCDDAEACLACQLTYDRNIGPCLYHMGVEDCAAYVSRKVGDDLAATLFPEI